MGDARPDTPPPARRQLAAVLAETTQELESLRSRFNEVERRANHFEAMYKSLKSGPSEDVVRVLEQRVYDAEKRRDEEIARRMRMTNSWIQFRDQLRLLESQASEARAAMDRAMDSPSLAYHHSTSSRTRARDEEVGEYPPSKRSRTTTYQPTLRVESHPPQNPYPRSRSSSNASSKSIDELIIRAAGPNFPPTHDESNSPPHHRTRHAHHGPPSLSPPLHRQPAPTSPAYPPGYSYPPPPPPQNQYPQYGSSSSSSVPRSVRGYGPQWETNRPGSGPQQQNHHRPVHWPHSEEPHTGNSQTHVFISGPPSSKKPQSEIAASAPPESSSFYPPVNAAGQRICRQCGQPGRYKDGKCVEKWGPGPMGSGTVCDRCRKKMKRVERRSTLETLQQQSKAQPQLTPSQAQALSQSDTQPDSQTQSYRTLQSSSTIALNQKSYSQLDAAEVRASSPEHRGRSGKLETLRSVGRTFARPIRLGGGDNGNEKDELASGRGSGDDAEGDASADAEMDVDPQRDRPTERGSDRGDRKSPEPYVYTRSTREGRHTPNSHDADRVGRRSKETQSPSSSLSDTGRRKRAERDGGRRLASKSPPERGEKGYNRDSANEDDPDGDGDAVDAELRLAVEAAEAKSSSSGEDAS